MAVRAIGISGYGIAYPRPWLPAPGSVREVVPAIGAVAWSARVLSSSSTSGTRGADHGPGLDGCGARGQMTHSKRVSRRGLLKKGVAAAAAGAAFGSHSDPRCPGARRGHESDLSCLDLPGHRARPDDTPGRAAASDRGAAGRRADRGVQPVLLERRRRARHSSRTSACGSRDSGRRRARRRRCQQHGAHSRTRRRWCGGGRRTGGAPCPGRRSSLRLGDSAVRLLLSLSAQKAPRRVSCSGGTSPADLVPVADLRDGTPVYRTLTSAALRT